MHRAVSKFPTIAYLHGLQLCTQAIFYSKPQDNQAVTCFCVVAGDRSAHLFSCRLPLVLHFGLYWSLIDN